MDICLRVLKSVLQLYSLQGQCIVHIPFYLSGLSRAHFFSDNLSRNSCIRSSVGQTGCPGRWQPEDSSSLGLSSMFRRFYGASRNDPIVKTKVSARTLRLPSDGAYRMNRSVDTILLVAGK